MAAAPAVRPGAIRIIEGDARTLPGVAPGSVALVVTSPPYPMVPQWDAMFAAAGARDFDAMHRYLAPVWAACQRALLPGGILAINVGDAVRTVDGEFRLWPNHTRISLECERLGFRSLPYVLWQKPTNRPNAFLGSGFDPPNAYVTLDCEFVLLFRHGARRRFPKRDPARAASRYSRAERDRWFSQVWRDVRPVRQGPEGRRTGAFPPALAERLIRMFSVIGDTVLDPFAGTGTTLWEAARWGRDAIGVELDPGLASALGARAARITPPRAAGGRASGPRSPR